MKVTTLCVPQSLIGPEVKRARLAEKGGGYNTCIKVCAFMQQSYVRLPMMMEMFCAPYCDSHQPPVALELLKYIQIYLVTHHYYR